MGKNRCPRPRPSRRGETDPRESDGSGRHPPAMRRAHAQRGGRCGAMSPASKGECRETREDPRFRRRERAATRDRTRRARVSSSRRGHAWKGWSARLAPRSGATLSARAARRDHGRPEPSRLRRWLASAASAGSREIRPVQHALGVDLLAPRGDVVVVRGAKGLRNRRRRRGCRGGRGYASSELRTRLNILQARVRMRSASRARVRESDGSYAPPATSFRTPQTFLFLRSKIERSSRRALSIIAADRPFEPFQASRVTRVAVEPGGPRRLAPDETPMQLRRAAHLLTDTKSASCGFLSLAFDGLTQVPFFVRQGRVVATSPHDYDCGGFSPLDRIRPRGFPEASSPTRPIFRRERPGSVGHERREIAVGTGRSGHPSKPRCSAVPTRVVQKLQGVGVRIGGSSLRHIGMRRAPRTKPDQNPAGSVAGRNDPSARRPRSAENGARGGMTPSRLGFVVIINGIDGSPSYCIGSAIAMPIR